MIRKKTRKISDFENWKLIILKDVKEKMLDGILDESYSINYIKIVRRRTARTERNEKIAN